MAMSVGSDDNDEGSIASINTTPLVDVMPENTVMPID